MPSHLRTDRSRRFTPMSFGGSVAATLLVGLSVAAGSQLLASADPATGPGAVGQWSAGALAPGTIPPGTCRARVHAAGGGGGSSPGPEVGVTGGVGAPGAVIDATFAVVPGQSYSGSAGGAGTKPLGGSGASGLGQGGSGGTVANSHRGAGGGGRSSGALAGSLVVIAGGGGGGGASHDLSPAGFGGSGGFVGIAPGTAVAGSNGRPGVDGIGLGLPRGGRGGQVAAGGAGGVHSTDTDRNGSPGTGVGTGNGGQGGSDLNIDSGGGGGGGYTGGGGGAATVGSSVTGGGGGGGSSWVAATSPVAGAPAPTGVRGAAGDASPPAGSGASGSVAIDFEPCLYDLSVDTTVSPPAVHAGDTATWTVTVTNHGPDPMTLGDTVDLTNTLPAGPNGGPGPDNEITSFVVSGGVDSGLDRGSVTCSGVAVGAAMPATTNCSRAYGASGAAEAPSGGLRGLDPGESIEITYQQVISNSAPCDTITNTAAVIDRPTQTGAASDVQGLPETSMDSESLVIECYDLGITKTADPAPHVGRGGVLSWTVTVTNGSAVDMEGPADTTANPLVVTDVFPSSDVGPSLLVSDLGPAGPCTLTGSTTTCSSGLAGGEVQVLVYEQIVEAGALADTVIANTAGVIDPAVGDEDDTASAQVIVGVPELTTVKTTTTPAVAAVGDVIDYSITVTNSGNVPISAVVVTDPVADTGSIACAPATPLSLAPTEATTCTATHTVEQADLDAASVTNVAAASGTDPWGGAVVGESEPVVVPATQAPRLSLVKRGEVQDENGDGFAQVGETVVFSFEVANTGNVNVVDLSVSDPLVAVDGGVLASLSPGATDGTSFQATYVLTQRDLDAGQVVNQATVTGTDPNGAPVSDVSDDESGAPGAQAPTVVEILPAQQSAGPAPGATGPAVLPRTGEEVGDLVLSALACLIVGVGLLLHEAARRRTIVE